MTMAMISSESPSRQGARTEFLVPGLGFLVVAAQRNFSVEYDEPPVTFRSRGVLYCEGGAEGLPGVATPCPGAAWA
jgi:hypothetical protein